MDWYLPERMPIVCEEVRRRILRWRSRYLWVIVITQAAGLVVALAVFLLGGFKTIDQSFWSGVMAVQGWLVLLLAPGLAVSTFSAERERESIVFLFLIPVPVRSLVLQKYAGACLLLLLILLCFLPVQRPHRLARNHPAPRLPADVPAGADARRRLCRLCLAGLQLGAHDPHRGDHHLYRAVRAGIRRTRTMGVADNELLRYA